MKKETINHYSSRLKQKSILTFKKLKQSLKTAKTALKTSIETILFYRSEMKLQLKVFKVSSKDINRF